MRVSSRRLRLLLVRELGEARAQFIGEAVEAPPPAVARADYCRIDQQLFPAPRCAQLAIAHRRFRPFRGNSLRRLRRRLRPGRPCPHLVASVSESAPPTGRRGAAAGGARLGSRIRNLAEREIFGKAAGRQAFKRASEQGEEGAAGRIGTAGATREVNRDRRRGSKASSRLARYSSGERSRTAIRSNANAFASTRQHAAGDLDAFTAFAGGRKDLDGVDGRATATANSSRKRFRCSLRRGDA